MPTKTETRLAWYQCQVCMETICKSKPIPSETALERALKHVQERHHIAYPDSLAMVVGHRPKA